MMGREHRSKERRPAPKSDRAQITRLEGLRKSLDPTNGLTGPGGAKKEHASTLQRSHIDAGAEDVTVHGLSYLCLSRAAWRTQHLIECVQRE